MSGEIKPEFTGQKAFAMKQTLSLYADAAACRLDSLFRESWN